MSFDELPDGAFPDYPVSGAPNYVSGPGFWSMLRIVGPGLRRYRAAMVLPMTMPCKNEDGAPSKQCGASENMLWCCY